MQRLYKINKKTHNRIFPFVTEYRQSVSNLKQILMNKWHLIQNHPLLREIFKNTPLISYRKGSSLKNVLVKPGSHLRHNDITGRSRKGKKYLVLMFYVSSVNNTS